jgi:uncharacterized protein (DUF1015 family)
MVEIRPFRAIRYNQEKIKIEDVISQPYDKITPEMQNQYYEKSPYNYVRVILGRSGDRYREAVKNLWDWFNRGILIKEDEESIYPYNQEFVIDGKKRVRKGFVCVFKLAEYDEGVVLRHELTLSKPKEDRMRLMESIKKDSECIFVLHNSEVDLDYENEIASCKDYLDVTHRMWKMSDKEHIEKIKNGLLNDRLLIADGHHRYETSLRYRNEVGKEDGYKKPSDYIMAAFVNINDPGLVILPTHRLLYNLDTTNISKMEEYFEIEKLDKCTEPGKHELVLYTGNFYLLKLRDEALLDDPAHSKDYNLLDVNMLHKLIIRNVFGIKNVEEHVLYERNREEGMKKVEEGKAQLLFILHPTTIEEVKRISQNGEMMPQKSTDFYPKMISGLTAFDLEEW